MLKHKNNRPLSIGVNVPILFLIFNRPDTTKKVFAAIRKVKPKQLFIAADGPRENKISEKEKCGEAREITEKIDWPCKVKRLYRNKNLGCKLAVSGAIDWFFKNVEEGIILEDDCLPGEDFFVFCKQMLLKYRNDPKIMHISGDNYQDDNNKEENSYYFSKYSQSWGWATWRRAWKKYDVNMKDWTMMKNDKKLNKFFDSFLEKQYWSAMLDLTFFGKIDTWDYQWQYICWKNKALSILPGVNLVENIGFGRGATHTIKDSLKLQRNIEKMIFPLLIPDTEDRDIKKDKNDSKVTFGINIPTVLFLKKLYFLRKLGIG